jgi:AhpD family alkylhydroperoxidase
MVRIPLLPLEEAPPDLSRLIGDAPPNNLHVFLHMPDVARAFAQFQGTLQRSGTLPRRLIELVRLRVAFHNQCRSCMAVRYEDGASDGVTEALVCQLEQPEQAADLSETERLALAFADKMATNHLSIDDELIDRLREHFSDVELVELGVNVAMFVGFGRLASAWSLIDQLPSTFRDATPDDVVTPWGSESVLVRRATTTPAPEGL